MNLAPLERTDSIKRLQSDSPRGYEKPTCSAAHRSWPPSCFETSPLSSLRCIVSEKRCSVEKGRNVWKCLYCNICCNQVLEPTEAKVCLCVCSLCVFCECSVCVLSLCVVCVFCLCVVCILCVLCVFMLPPTFASFFRSLNSTSPDSVISTPSCLSRLKLSHTTARQSSDEQCCHTHTHGRWLLFTDWRLNVLFRRSCTDLWLQVLVKSALSFVL